jgi:hypothetical protein
MIWSGQTISKAGYARNPRKLNHKVTKDTKEGTQRQEEEDFLFSPAGWTPGKRPPRLAAYGLSREGLQFLTFVRVFCAFVVQKILSLRANCISLS